MKQILVALLIAVATATTLPQTKLTETFESTSFPPSGWSMQYSGTLYWERQGVGGYGASSASAAFLFFEAPELTQQSLLSSLFTATVSGDSLSFDHAYATFESRVDSLIVEASGDGGASFFRIAALAGGTTVGSGLVTAPPSPTFFTPTSAQWGRKRIGLPPGVNRIRFTALSDFGNNLFLDNITVAQALVNDIGVSLVSQPRYFLNLPYPVRPAAKITNFGTASQSSPFTTTLIITGPGGFNYSSTSADTVPAGASTSITFPALFAPTLPGAYTVQCFTNLPSDQFRANDTLRQTVIAANYNYGTNGGSGASEYFFVNSLTGNGAPAQPSTGWKDTTGSIDLIANGVPLAPMTGDIDDGYFTLAGMFPGRAFRLFGTNYSDTMHISTNGVISFSRGFQEFLPAAIPSGQSPNGALYPFWADLDFSDPDVPGSRLSYKRDGELLIITFTRAPRFNLATDSTDYVTFQVCLRFSSSPSSNSFMRVEFDYAATGSSFFSAFEQHTFPHLIGAENANGTEAVTYRFANGTQPVTPGPLFGSSLALTLGPSYASGVSVNLNVILEGPFSLATQKMRTDLRTVLPLVQPYSTTPWLYIGSETAIALPDSIVDWVMVELRRDTAYTTIAARKAGFLKSDGRIVDVAGNPLMSVDLLSPGNYYLVFHHRNHLAIMSSAPVALSATSAPYDFTTAQTQAYGTDPMVELLPGIFALVAGDANTSSIITAADANLVYGSLNAVSYSLPDVNMSGIVTAADANAVFRNINRASSVPSGGVLSPGPVRYLQFPAAQMSKLKRSRIK